MENREEEVERLIRAMLKRMGLTAARADYDDILQHCRIAVWTRFQRKPDLLQQFKLSTVVWNTVRWRMSAYWRVRAQNSRLQTRRLIENDPPTYRDADPLEAEDRSRQIRQLLDSLSPRLRRLVVLYYGLENAHQHTLQEIANRHKCTRENIRQRLVQARRLMLRQAEYVAGLQPLFQKATCQTPPTA